jgi:hypothetical protein
MIKINYYLQLSKIYLQKSYKNVYILLYFCFLFTYSKASYNKISFSFKITKSIKREVHMRRRFIEKMWPQMLNILSTAAELASTPRYFFF